MISSESTQSRSAEKTALIEKNLDFAASTARKLAQNLPIETDDAVQLGYAGLIQAADRFNIEKYDPALGSFDNHFRSFAYKRIVGSLIDHTRRDSFVRRRGREKGISFHFESIDAISDPGDYGYEVPGVQLESLADDPVASADFRDALQLLTPRERFVLIAFGQGYKGPEIAEALGVSESRISQIAKLARSKMAEGLDGYDH